MLILSLIGPGIIAGAAGNDAGGIATYSQAGAQFGLHLLWALTVVTIGLVVVQEMCSRMGAVTGKGLADLIRENFGVKITFFAMSVLVVANLAITVSEFAGIAAVGEMFHPHGGRFFVVPAAMVIVWALVSKGSYQKVERVFLVASLVFSAYILTALKVGVPWGKVGEYAFAPPLHDIKWTGPMVAMVVPLIGTSISPYMQFYQQSAVRDKGIRIKDYALAKWDSILGSSLSMVIAAFIIVTCAVTLYPHPELRTLATATDVAMALKALAGGEVAKYLFAFGLLNASLLAATVVPLSTAYAVTEALGWESGMGRRIRELPLFYGTYGGLILLGGLTILVLPPGSSLINIIEKAQSINAILLPVELVLILILINKRRVMGQHRNGIIANSIGVATAVVTAILSVIYLFFLPN